MHTLRQSDWKLLAGGGLYTSAATRDHAPSRRSPRGTHPPPLPQIISQHLTQRTLIKYQILKVLKKVIGRKLLKVLFLLFVRFVDTAKNVQYN